ncbi:SRPBCC domain-containing protein [Maribacter polysaccharolyticus]|uniref:SRPBCC domain-containing protein n=1 Tax=Maribacter polysaccharolyticus TaxID=3020831 RepID=UPI00237FAEB3|nr:SRPBCC domain-containing protein [Maribacter polysaccharolyticus]MDE3743428.1 SRPBCC domain-containing protein [Maribacter polysaccharolyticus]
MKLVSNATLQIQKPINEVFEGIVDPAKLTQYFISESSGRLESGKDVIWKFPEFDDKYPIKNVNIEPNRSITFVWDPDTAVQIILEAQTDKSTIVKVTETEREFGVKNLEWVISNTGGWANFLACMKAYLEYGIQLRKGAFDFMKKD